MCQKLLSAHLPKFDHYAQRNKSGKKLGIDQPHEIKYEARKLDVKSSDISDAKEGGSNQRKEIEMRSAPKGTF
jgi:hypothetical protein